MEDEISASFDGSIVDISLVGSIVDFSFVGSIVDISFVGSIVDFSFDSSIVDVTFVGSIAFGSMIVFTSAELGEISNLPFVSIYGEEREDSISLAFSLSCRCSHLPSMVVLMLNPVGDRKGDDDGVVERDKGDDGATVEYVMASDGISTSFERNTAGGIDERMLCALKIHSRRHSWGDEKLLSTFK